MNFSKITDIFFPPRCPGCDRIPDSDFPVCNFCKDLIIHPSKTKNSCEVCFMSPDNCVCSKRQFFEKLSFSFAYEGTPKKMIFKLKFRARPDIAKSYAKLLYYSLNERNMLDKTDIITFIPMSSFSKFKRGYNQSALTAKYLSALCGKPCLPLLDKIIKTKSQHKLNQRLRSGNLLGAFEPNKKYLNVIVNKTILVIDDVSTTGATFNEIAKTLLIFGAESVYAAACTATKKSKKRLNTKI